MSVWRGKFSREERNAPPNEFGEHSMAAMETESNKLLTLEPGESFGEFALMQDGGRRAATTVVDEPTIFAKVWRKDYTRTVAAIHERKSRECVWR